MIRVAISHILVPPLSLRPSSQCMHMTITILVHRLYHKTTVTTVKWCMDNFLNKEARRMMTIVRISLQYHLMYSVLVPHRTATLDWYGRTVTPHPGSFPFTIHEKKELAHWGDSNQWLSVHEIWQLQSEFRTGSHGCVAIQRLRDKATWLEQFVCTACRYTTAAKHCRRIGGFVSWMPEFPSTAFCSFKSLGGFSVGLQPGIHL